MNDKIDIVLPWVDGADPEWLAEKEKWYTKLHPDEKSNSNIRFESWDNLQYWFRAIEKFMPWVNKIFFITYGHLPEFLNVNHPKLRIVKHAEYIPKEYLPTFNSNVIEMNLHRIEDLSENFLLFNDDLFPLQPIEETYYFKDNIVCDEAVEGQIIPTDIGVLSNWAKYVQINNMVVINRHFKKRDVQEKNWDKWYCEDYGELLERTKVLSYWYDFAAFRDPHMANAMKKSTLEHLWEIETETLHKTSSNRFRDYSDVSQYLIRYWQLCMGNFNPRHTKGKSYLVTTKNYLEIANVIAKQGLQMVSLNESCTPEEFVVIRECVNKALEKILPEKSKFER